MSPGRAGDFGSRGLLVEQELFVRPGGSAIFISWRILDVVAGGADPGHPGGGHAPDQPGQRPQLQRA